MKIALVLAALALASCKESKPAAEAPAPSAAEPAPGTPMEPNKAVKYVQDLQADVKRAEEAKAKADAANKKAREAENPPQ